MKKLIVGVISCRKDLSVGSDFVQSPPTALAASSRPWRDNRKGERK